MLPAVVNPFKLTWGTFSVGGNTERLITGLHRIQKTFEFFEVSLDVLVRGSSDEDFTTKCAEIESEFTKRRQKIVFTIGTNTEHTYDPDALVNTGLNPWARIEKSGTENADTGRSRLYTISVGCELPATDTSGRRDSDVSVSYDASKRRTVTISGVWTAVTTKDATEQYAAQIAAYCASALAALLPSGTFELVGQNTQADDQDKVLTFTRSYSEVGHIAGDTILANANIASATLGWQRQKQHPGDSGGGGVKRLEVIVCRFDCNLDKEQSTDLATLYTGTVRPYLLAAFSERYSPSQYAIVAEQTSPLVYGNMLSASLTFEAAIDATGVIEAVGTSRIVEGGAVTLTGEWTGEFFTKHQDFAIGTRRRFGIRAATVLGSLKPTKRIGESGGGVFGVGGDLVLFDGLGGSRPVRGGPPIGSVGGGGGWVLVDNDSSVTVKTKGEPGESQFTISYLVERTVEEWVVDPGGGGGGIFSGGGEQAGPSTILGTVIG